MTARAPFHAPSTPNHNIASEQEYGLRSAEFGKEYGGLLSPAPSSPPPAVTRRNFTFCAVAGLVAAVCLVLLGLGIAARQFVWTGDASSFLGHGSDPARLLHWHANGHVYLASANLLTRGTPHPIHQLIADAYSKWQQRIARQSKTLSEAVTEYKRRYARPPPKGFDKWFALAQESGVILVDDFDGIDEDIAPFLALDPVLLRARMAAVAAQPNTHTLVIKNGGIDIQSGHGDAGMARARDQRELLVPCMHWLSDTNISISPHDGPSVLMDYEHKRRHREAGQRGNVLPNAYADSVDDDPSLWGFPLACAPNSRLRRAYDGLELGSLPLGLSFVHDHVAAMDLCHNPEWQDLHGFTSWPGPRPSTLQPIFSMSRSTMHSDIRLTPLEQYRDTFDSDPEWELKGDDRALWRGSTTGVWFDHWTRWRSSQRVRLYWMSQSPTGDRLVRSARKHRGQEVLAETRAALSTLYDRYLDFAFTGEIHQCTEEDRGCEAARRAIKLAPGMIWNDQNRYKYLLDIDGNAWSGRFHRLMSSNSLVLKATIFKEWYSDRIQPWLHYVPIDPSYIDLFDVLSFFSGDLDGKNGHDHLARDIAQAGKRWTQEHWRVQDMRAYTSRLALEWARATALDRRSMDFVM